MGMVLKWTCLEGSHISIWDPSKHVHFKTIGQAPIGPLQFKKPEAAEGWEGVREAKSWPPRCIQSRKVGNIAEHRPTDTQDCLFLNVFSPDHAPLTVESGYPVMVWIHGGGFAMGATDEYGIEGITERLVPNGVIVVTIQYRMGIWGFMSTGDEVLPGNLGLWDQTMALKWVQDNIASFGGNQNKVTIFGQSAGGASVTALNASPHSNKLFHQMIAMSGSINAKWALRNDQVVKSSKELAEIIGCNLSSSQQTIECIRNKTPDEQVQAVTEFRARQAGPAVLSMPFVPREDGDFFPEPVEILQTKAPYKPIVVGATAADGAYLAAPPHQLWNSTHEIFDQTLFEQIISKGTPGDDIIANISKLLIQYHYIVEHEKEKTKDPHKPVKENPKKPHFKQFIQFLCDQYFHAPAQAQAVHHSGKGPTWAYSFDHFNPAAFPVDHLFKGAQHATDLVYIFDEPFFQPFQFNRDDESVAEFTTKSWTNFAKYGNPTPAPLNGVTWDQYNNINGNFLSIKARPKMKYGYFKKAATFWNEFIPEIISQLKGVQS